MHETATDTPFNEDDYDLLSPDDTEGHARWLATAREEVPHAERTAEALLALLLAKGTGSFGLSDADKHTLGTNLGTIENDFEHLMQARLLAVRVRHLHPNEYVLVDHLLTT